MTRNVIVCCVLFATSILTAAADPVFQQSPTPEVNPWAEKGIPSDFQFGAYGTRKNVGQPWHRQSRTDDYADVSVRFENAYATPVCTPTRAMSLTGLHPNQTVLHHRSFRDHRR